MLSLIEQLESIRDMTDVLSASALVGYPYADVSEMGASFVVVTDNQPALALSLAKKLSTWMTKHRERFRGELMNAAEAVCRANSAPKPVGLLDMGDNMGGGAPSDSTVLAHLLDQRNRGASFICLCDPESVSQARAAGVDAMLVLRMGGKSKGTPMPPLEARVTVKSLPGGRYQETQPRHSGLSNYDMGKTAVVSTKTGLTIMLTTRPADPSSLQQLISCSLNPSDFDIIVLKGVHAPIAGYREVCKAFFRVNTPGATTAAIESLSYRNRRRPLFPFEA